MRNLPFYVASSTSAAPAACWEEPLRTTPVIGGLVQCDYKDLLDTYYRSRLHLATTTADAGFVASDANRSADEVAANLSAPFYRFVIDPVPDFPKFSQVIVSQFLNAARQIQSPGLTYNTQNSNTDLPPSRLLGVTVLTKWKIGSRPYKYVTSSQIVEGSIQPTNVTLQAEATALRLKTGLDLQNSAQIEGDVGISKAGGTLGSGASATTSAQGGYAAFVPGTRADGEYATASVPPASSASGGTSGPVALVSTTPAFTAATLASTDTGDHVTAGIVGEQPAVPTSQGTNLSSGMLLKSGAAYDLSFTNAPSSSLTGMPFLDGTKPMVWTKVTGASTIAANGGTLVASESGSSHFAESRSQASLYETSFLPTSFAPLGLIRVELISSLLTCKTSGTSTTGSGLSFAARIMYYTTSGYQTLEFTSAGPNPALPALNSVTVNSAPTYTLANYLREWSVTSNPTNTIAPDKSTISSSVNGIVRLVTQNTRPAQEATAVPDDASSINAGIGLLSCSAEDKRR